MAWSPTEFWKLASSSDDSTVRLWTIDREARAIAAAAEEEAARGAQAAGGERRVLAERAGGGIHHTPYTNSTPHTKSETPHPTLLAAEPQHPGTLNPKASTPT